MNADTLGAPAPVDPLLGQLSHELPELDQLLARLFDGPGNVPIPLAQIAAILPRRRAGRKTHISTIYNWTSKGCRGVKLEYVQVGATRCVTRSQLADFLARLTGQSQRPGPVDSGPLADRTEAVRHRAIRRAERAYERLDPGAK
jgi:hypothetical protein